MQTYTTPERHGYSVRFSPFEPNLLLLASSQLYGLAGGGTLFLLQIAGQDDTGAATAMKKSTITELSRLEWTDGLFDVVWCPYADNIAATSSGDGSLQIWGVGSIIAAGGVSASAQPQKPLICLQEHKNEVYSIDWGEQWNFHQLISASWDGSIKLWDCNRQHSISTFIGGHTDLIYCARYSPLIANLFASVGTDGYLNLWNSFDFSGKPLMSIQAGGTGAGTGAGGGSALGTSSVCEVLTCDWSQYDRNVLATGGSDGIVRAWDLRNMRQPIFELFSGEFAVRRLVFSPTSTTVLATANFDFTTRIWDFKRSFNALEVHQHHSEFVCGLDWNLNRPHQLADCGWDAVLNVFTPKSLRELE